MSGERKPNGYFSKMTDEGLIEYVGKNHLGKSLSAFREDSQAYNVAKERGLSDKLVDEGILIRAKRPSGFFKRMTDEQVIDYVKERYKGNTLSELKKKDNGAYRGTIERKLVDRLVDDGILIRKINPRLNITCLLEDIAGAGDGE